MSLSEKRTQVYLPAELHAAIKELAMRRSQSFSSVVRAALHEHLRTTATDDAPTSWKSDRLYQAAGSIALPMREKQSLDEDIDDVLYGKL